jgi:hypothetical protein
MRCFASAGMALLVVAGIGCGGGGNNTPNTKEVIASSIGDGCKTNVVREPFPGDPGHAQFRSLADTTVLIRCVGHPRTWAYDNLSAYARFENRRRLTRALASIDLPPGRSESFCVTNRDAFTTQFYGSQQVCRQLGGDERKLRRPPTPYATTHRTYLAQDGGSAHYLIYKPPLWSNGGTAGSDNLNDVRWQTWTPDFALGIGTSGLRGPCAIGAGPLPRSKCHGQNAYYQAPARVVLDEPRFCNDQGSTIRFFSRARFQVYMRPGNPFGERVGWVERKWPVNAYNGKCFYFPAGPLSG